ncbi:MAG: hypothetical protein D3908_12400 [Candidatus Electrothrix sp. AUS4]|nr:hypothetical protein [Candidatus Electrothrix sp. AUS4]
MVLTEKGIVPEEVVDARKEKIAEDDAWVLIGAARELIVGRGKKFEIFHPAQDEKEVILKACLGRTGNLRAPALKMGKRMVIGFNDAMYEQFVGEL